MSNDNSSTSTTPQGDHGSNVIWLNSSSNNNSNNQTTGTTAPTRIRVAKLVGLQGYTEINPTTGNAQVETPFLYNAVASFLASQQFNERRGDILPHLPHLLEGCNFYWSYDYRDGQQQGLQATRQLMHVLDVAYQHKTNEQESGQEHGLTPASTSANTNSNSTAVAAASTSSESTRDIPTTKELQQAAQFLEPFAVYGAFWSRVSKTVTAVTAAFEIPYIAGVSTSSELDGVPFFARTSPSNEGDAQATILYYHRQLGISHLAVLFVKDSWGINYYSALSKYANRVNMTLASFAYDPESIETTLLALKKSQLRYVFAILHNWRQVLPLAYTHQLVGVPDHVWIAAEEKKWTGQEFQLSRRDITEQQLALALHGIGTLNVYFEPVPAFERAMGEMASNRTLQRQFIDIQGSHPELFDNFTFPKYDPTGFANAIFDAVLALGVTACNVSHNLPDLFTGKQFYQALKKTEFVGVSGHVQFDPDTGSRLAKNVRYSVEYLVLSEERSNDEYFRFESNTVAIMQQDNLTNYHPFIYNDNTTVAPLPLPPVTGSLQLNLVPLWAQIFGYVLSGLVILVSLLCFWWTVSSRNIFVVKASQPFFLCQLCVGTFIMAVAVIPWSFPLTSSIRTQSSGAFDIYYSNNGEIRDTKGLDVACMSTLWFIIVGFAICFSALASKTWRLNQLMSLGSAMRRSTVSVNDAMSPLYISLTFNVVMLLCITFISPFKYERVQVDHYDTFDRSIESYPSCRPSNSNFYYLGGTLLAVNFLGVAVVTYEAYKGRNAPLDFSDANYLALSMMSLLETLIMGAPLLIVVGENPTAFYLVGSSLLCVCCLTILLLLFLPKYLGRRKRFGVQSVVSAIHRTSANTNKRFGLPTSSNGSRSVPHSNSETPGRMMIVRQNPSAASSTQR